MAFTKSKAALCGSVALATLICAGEASAQQAAAPAEAAGVDQIIVTGSRVIRDGTQAPTPVTVMTTEMLQESAPVSIADGLNDLPVFAGSTTPTTTGGNSDNTGLAYLNLRNLGRERSLVMMDGIRIVTSGTNGVADLQSIPSVLIERTEIVTGGASAAYGSNAVAGVLNLITDSDFTGVKASTQWGKTSRGDNENYSWSLAAGAPLMDGRGHLVVSAEWARSEGIWQRDVFGADGFDPDRPYTVMGKTLINNPRVTAANPISATNPRLIAADNTRINSNEFGVIASGPLALQSFNADGSLKAYNPGSVRGGAQITQGGDGFNWRTQVPLEGPYRRSALYSRLTFDIVPDAVTFYAQGMRAENHGFVTYLPNFSQGQYAAGMPIMIDNAFLAPSTVAAMRAANVSQINVHMIAENLPRYQSDNPSSQTQVMGGLKGRLLDNWDWDVSYSYGINKLSIDTHGGFNMLTHILAIDSIRNPAVGGVAGVAPGTIVCRSRLTNPGNGCVPYNILGNNPASEAAIKYVTGDSITPTTSQQSMFDASITGEAFSLPAGPVGVAVGVHYRKEEVVRIANAVSTSINPVRGTATGSWMSGNLQGFAGDQAVKEVFGEINVPLLSGVAFAENLSVNGAARYTDYQTSGGVTTWKVGGSWEPVTGLRFRATRSRDIRAPLLIELYSGAQQGPCSVVDRVTNTNTVTSCFSSGGNPNLVPERANTLTYGVVLRPTALPGFYASVDRYSIQIKDAIGGLGSQLIIDQCFEGNKAICALIARNPSTNTIASVTSSLLNLSLLDTAGIDVETGYTKSLADFSSLPGVVNFRLIGSYIEKLRTETPGSAPRDVAGGGSTPHWRATIFLNYANGPFRVGSQIRWIGKSKYDNTLGPLDIDQAELAVSPEMYVGLNASYKFQAAGADMEVFGVIENVLDPTPPTIPGGFNQGQTNRQLYDPTGRQFRVGIRAQF